MFNLLYQIQVKNKQGDYIKASPIDDTVVINIGDLMQRWTTDKLVSTVSLHLFHFHFVKASQDHKSLHLFGKSAK